MRAWLRRTGRGRNRERPKCRQSRTAANLARSAPAVGLVGGAWLGASSSPSPPYEPPQRRGVDADRDREHAEHQHEQEGVCHRAAPWPRTGGERRKNSVILSGTLRSDSCRFVPFRSDIVLGSQNGDARHVLMLREFFGRSAEI